MTNGDRVPLEEGFPSNVGLSKSKMTTSATLGLGKNCPHNKKAWTNGCLVNQASGTLQPLVHAFLLTKLVVLFNHWFMLYKVARGRLSFQCGTLQAKNDYKCKTWSRQKLSLQ